MKEEEKDHMLEVLQFNQGFSHPEEWLDYGITHNFRRIQAKKLEECPDCDSLLLTHLGQFVYYSTLVNLQSCNQCGLIFSDTRIDPKVIQIHFEQAYKDETYFLKQRRRVFEQISSLADYAAIQGGWVLDVGGAKGHLLAMLKKRRPDLNFVLNDLSKEACDHAESEYDFKTILGGIDELEKVSFQFDVIILSDVIYYEPDLRKLWDVLPRLISDNGTVIIRVPNKLALVRSWQFIRRITSSHSRYKMQTSIKYFNPEHLFVFSRQYLLKRLKSLGFNHPLAVPSELLINQKKQLRYSLFYYLCKIVWLISFGLIIITPSLLVVARKNNSSK